MQPFSSPSGTKNVADMVTNTSKMREILWQNQPQNRYVHTLQRSAGKEVSTKVSGKTPSFKLKEIQCGEIKVDPLIQWILASSYSHTSKLVHRLHSCNNLFLFIISFLMQSYKAQRNPTHITQDTKLLAHLLLFINQHQCIVHKIHP